MKAKKAKRILLHTEAKRARYQHKVSGFVSDKPTAAKAVLAFVEREKLVTALTVARKFRITERAASVRLWRCRLAGFLKIEERDGKRVFVIAESRPEPRRRRKAISPAEPSADEPTRRASSPASGDFSRLTPMDMGITPAGAMQ